MSYYNGNTNHLGKAEASAGPTSSFGENFSAAYDRQYRVDSMLALESELTDAYEANALRVKELTGEDVSLPSIRSDNILKSAFNRKMNSAGIFGDALAEENLGEFDSREARILELQKQYPDIKSFDQLLEDVKATRKQIEEEAGQVSSRAGFVGSLGNFAGAIAGSFSQRDPLLVGSLFMGGFGPTIAKRMLAEAGIGAGVEAVQQFGSVQPTRALLGEEPSNPWESIALAGIGAGALRGAFEGAAPAFRNLERRLSPQRAYARAIEQGLGEAQMNEALIGRMIERAPDTPQTRGARAAYDAQKALTDGSPYGASRFSQEAYMAELQRTVDSYDGIKATAVQAPEQPLRPAFMEEVSFNKALLHSENPALINALDDVGARVTAADARVAELQTAVQNRTVGDAVALIDEVSGARVKAIEEELGRPGANVAALERELDTIVSSIGEDVIARAEKDFRIGPKRQLASARQSARAAQREYNRVAKRVDEALTAMKDRHAAENAVKALASIRAPEGLTLPRGQHIGDGVVSPLDPLRVQDFAKSVEKATVETPKIAEAIVRAPREEGKIDIGLGEPIDSDTLFPVGMDENGNVVVRTAKQIMEDLDEDVAMVEAMRGCAI